MANKRNFDWYELVENAANQVKQQTRNPNINRYAPHRKQFEFHKSDKKRKLYIGGNRSGKTTAGVCEGIWRAIGKHPYRETLNDLVPSRGRVVGVDFKQGIDLIIIPQYKQWTPASELRGGSWESAYNSSSRILNFRNGSTIEFMSYDQDLDKFAGTSRHWIHFDEEPPRPIWVECLARLVDTNGEFWMTMTPVEGVTWVYDDLYEDNVNNADGDVEVIEIQTIENPYLTVEGIEGLRKVIDDDDVTARLEGKFVLQGGKIYKNFDPTPGAEQVLAEPIDDPNKMFPNRNWLWIMGLDHGLNNPTAVLWMAVDSAGFCVVFDEYYMPDKTIDYHAAEIKRRIAQHGRFPDILVADPSIKNRMANTGTSIRQEYQKYKLNFILGNNDVKSGLVRVRKYLNKHPYFATSYRRPEFFGGPKPGDNLDAYVPPPITDYYKLQISPKCEKLIWEMKRYRWMTYTNKKLQFERNAYEEPNKKDDHACDALRYMIMTRPDLVARDQTINEDKAVELVNQMKHRMSNIDYDDPLDLNSNPNYNPLVSGTPSDSTSGWQYDEHMGGIM